MTMHGKADEPQSSEGPTERRKMTWHKRFWRSLSYGDGCVATYADGTIEMNARCADDLETQLNYVYDPVLLTVNMAGDLAHTLVEAQEHARKQGAS